MPTEICSPITRRGSKASGNLAGSSPGAFSNPSRGGRGGSVPAQPAHGASRHSEEPHQSEVKIIGPTED
jgi:hypothetical protein